MDPAYAVEQGVQDAPNRLVFVHAGSDLGGDFDGLNAEAFQHAVELGQLNVTHLFTFTGEESSIWANLSLICAGTAGYEATREALLSEAGKTALTAIDQAGDQTPLREVISTAYDSAGVEADKVENCAFNRAKAVQYLSDWNRAQDSFLGQGADLYSNWPSFALNGTQMSAATVNSWFSVMIARAEQDQHRAMADATEAPESDAQTPVTAPDPAASDQIATATEASDEATSQESSPAPEPEASQDAPAIVVADSEQAPAPAETDTLTTATATQATTPPSAPAASETPATSEAETAEPEVSLPAAPATHAPYPTATASADARIPALARGIWAHSLADCLSYLDGLETPTSLDATLPPSGKETTDQALLLITSQNLSFFDQAGTECLLQQQDGSGDSYGARYHCISNHQDGPAVEITGLPPVKTVPRLDFRLAGADGVEMRQCRSLGQLSHLAAPLWQIDESHCTATAPLHDASLTFGIEAENLVLQVAPAQVFAGAAELNPAIRIDGRALGESSGSWTGEHWEFALGGFSEASTRIGRAMFLETRLSGGEGDTLYRLPLLGSSAAMKAIRSCAADQG
ncbi:MAG: hypothetical protein P8X51_14245 [Maritimibacter sp.]